MKIRRKIIVEAGDDVLRQNVLHNLLTTEEVDAVPFVRLLRYATTSQTKQYVKQIGDELDEIEMKENASNYGISSIFTGLFFICRIG